MSDQRQIFQAFYNTISKDYGTNGRIIGRQVYDLLCSQALGLRNYQEFQHQSYGRCAFFNVYVMLFRHGKQILLPGTLYFSMEYGFQKVPVITLKRDGRLLELNHSQVVDANGNVRTPMLVNWNAGTGNLVEAVRELINILQGDPYNYDEDDTDDKSTEETEQQEVHPPHTEFNPNIQYNELQKGRQLGEGAFAAVFECTYRGQKCAMKEMLRNPSNYEKTAFEREVEVQSSLNHPNCLKLYGRSVNPTNGRPVIVMQICSDGCLTDYILENKKPRLSKADKCRIILEIANGIAYLHSLGFVHRDLKLDNILMHDGHPVIADFGLSRKIDMQRSMQVTFAGSPVYIAPELVSGERVTNLIDVYSFGCMVNEIISEKQCYHDYRVINADRFFFDIRRGLRPTIDKRLPQEVKLLLEDCYKNKRCRPNMQACAEAISTWNPSEWTTIA